MNTSEVIKSKDHIVVELVEYVPGGVLSRTILKKTTGNVTALSFDIGEELGDNISPFDIFIQIIDGQAELIINKIVHQLLAGDGIIIPANATYCFNAKEKFKMISTVFESSYEM